MSKIRVLKIVEASVNYTADIEAESETDALAKAEADQYQSDPALKLKWEEDSVTEYDDEIQFEIDTVDPIVPE